MLLCLRYSFLDFLGSWLSADKGCTGNDRKYRHHLEAVQKISLNPKMNESLGINFRQPTKYYLTWKWTKSPGIDDNNQPAKQMKEQLLEKVELNASRSMEKLAYTIEYG